MTKDKRRNRRRLRRYGLIFAVSYIVILTILVVSYPVASLSPSPEQTLSEPPAPTSASQPTEEPIHETVAVQPPNTDVSVISVIEATDAKSQPEDEVIPLAYAPPAEMPAPSEDRELLAKVIEAEAGNQCLDGRIAVGNVVMNRIKSAYFPDTIYDVLYQYNDRWGGWQFTTAPALETTIPSELSYEAADAVLTGVDVLPGPKDGKLVVFFSRAGENSDVAIVIEDHVFCYAYRVEP